MAVSKEVHYFTQQDLASQSFSYPDDSLVIHQRKASNDVAPNLSFYLNSCKNWPIKVLDKNVEVLQITLNSSTNYERNRTQTIPLDITEEVYQLTSMLFTYYNQKCFHYSIDKMIELLVDRLFVINKERLFMSQTFLELRHFMESHIDQSFYRDDFGKALHMSSSTLDRLCQKHVQLSAKQLFREIKSIEGERMLKETSLPIKTISENLGFKNNKHFSTQFKKVTGKSPAEVRKSRRK
ncbi:helix-turn-helix transcriptional regulator [Enterococcus hulanensis]|uniref:helix-turn-helix domain-containing protein n=1 Tax=Enterococcus hulanensis TaxID=2559929 RepID=UPI001A8FCB3F|nr:AraC family transcriptional regulator [Enterococcus hulanensis]MBO0456901.1 helix-turn-helix transcriptional regulator [Enterococcus hulanensis]